MFLLFICCVVHTEHERQLAAEREAKKKEAAEAVLANVVDFNNNKMVKPDSTIEIENNMQSYLLNQNCDHSHSKLTNSRKSKSKQTQANIKVGCNEIHENPGKIYDYSS